MKISLATICFNSENTIGNTISSVSEQTYQDVEYIIIDGSSTDNTKDVITSHSQFKRVNRFISEPDHGVYDAMNKAIALSTGDVIGFLNADDQFWDNTVLAQVAEIFLDPEIDACYADLVYVREFDTSTIVRYWKSRDYSSGIFERGWMPAHPTFFVRKSVYEEFGLFDLQFKKQADFELTMRFMSVHRIKTVYVPRLWVRMRLGGISNRSLFGIIIANRESYAACKKHGLKIPIFPIFVIRKVCSRLPQFFSRPT